MQPLAAAKGHEDLFTPPRLSAGYRLGKLTLAGTQGNGRDAPTADVCDKGVFWKSPLRPRTMLSLKKAGILSCATRPG